MVLVAGAAWVKRMGTENFCSKINRSCQRISLRRRVRRSGAIIENLKFPLAEGALAFEGVEGFLRQDILGSPVALRVKVSSNTPELPTIGAISSGVPVLGRGKSCRICQPIGGARENY